MSPQVMSPQESSDFVQRMKDALPKFLAEMNLSAYYAASGSSIIIKYRLKKGKIKEWTYDQYKSQTEAMTLQAMAKDLGLDYDNLLYSYKNHLEEFVCQNSAFQEIKQLAKTNASGKQEAETKAKNAKNRFTNQARQRLISNLTELIKENHLTEEEVMDAFNMAQLQGVMET